ncbi:MAG: aminotransferase class I/II-fold pyridoxal phosphate-dependent enzyme [Caldilineales bacterium]|nr:aminotransferase class I/II-fold pyridoxal phosphate-dependent enzyme [Caldilineales bacterium]MDW8316933.1 aminotransferase class I/II-fold pyridoxal phosphate-dependent enzyme [Anaerolineae bacterium]
MGRISARVEQVPASGIRKFFDIAASMPEVISLGIGEPDFVTPDVIREAGIASLQRGETKYTSNSGTIELRRALAAKLEQLYGVSYNPDNELLITVGVSEALYLALNAILDPGDEVIVPQPSFVAYPAEVILAGGVVAPVPTWFEQDFQVTAAEIEAAVTPRTKALLIGYPNNPTGAVLSRQRLLEIAQVAERHDLLVISDEIYDRLVYGDHQHVCFSSLPGMKDRTILLGGMSKNYAMTGWRIGYAAAPPDLLGAMRKIHQYTIMSAPTTGQAAALAALTDPRAEEAVLAMRASYDRRRRLIVDGLNSIGLTCFEPQGAFYAFPNITASGMDEETFAWTLLEEEKVAVVPGSAFGEAGKGFVRCSYATSLEKIEQALERMHRFLRRHG